jgi:hypothetical protein
MLSFNRMTKLAAAAVASVTLLAAATTESQAQSSTGTVRLNIVRAGFIVGAGGGDGTLTFRGKTYRLSVGGVGIGSLGIASARLTGTASNLRTASDIAGTYSGGGAGAAVIGGGSVATLHNERGVVLRVRGPQVGAQVSLGLGGMTISLR